MNCRNKVLSISLIVVLSFTWASNISLASADLTKLDGLMQELKTYEYGQSRAPLIKLTNMIRNASGSPDDINTIQNKLLEFLRSDATFAAKQFVCRKLSLIGTEDAVPTLAPMLTDEKYSDMARYALEQIPGDAVDKALRDALDKTGGKVAIGIINSLGERRDKQAVKQLAKLLSNNDKEIAAAATAALGKIAGDKAADVLKDALAKSSGNLRKGLADAYLLCADNFLADGDAASAEKIYKQMYAPSEATVIRLAAFRGLISSASVQGRDITADMVEVLKTDDRKVQAAAIALVSEFCSTKLVSALSEQLPNLQTAAKIQLLSALGGCADPVALPAVLNEIKSDQESVRVAALNAVATLGNASNVQLLARTAALTKGAEQNAARESLYRLKGADVDSTILKGIPEAEKKIKVELIRSIESRNIKNANKSLMETAKDSDSSVRIESLKVLKTTAEPDDLSDLIKLLLDAQSKAEREEAQRTLAAVARKIPEDQSSSLPILEVLPSVTQVDAKCSLLGALGKIGDNSAIPAVLLALTDENEQVADAAVRSLADWPNPAPSNDLLNIAKQSENQTHRILALRGFIRMIGLDTSSSAQQIVEKYKQAMDLSTEIGEKKMVLGGLSNEKSPDALEMAAAFLDDVDLQQEAQAAVVKIAEFTIKTKPERTKEFLQKVIQTTKSEPLKQRAQYLMTTK